MSESPYISWSTEKGRASAMKQTEGNVDSYGSVMSASASRRSYLDIEPNISVRTDFTKDDYYAFRPGERPSDDYRQSMMMCMKAYEKVGIIKNVIDLMGDFASQGITLNHKDKKVERFYRKWWDMVNGTERSERFLNTLYRCGNVIINKRYAKLTTKQKNEMAKAVDTVRLNLQSIEKKKIPLKYDFLNPITIEVVGGYAGSFTGDKKYRMKISPTLKKSFTEFPELISSLPESVKPAIQGGLNYIDLDSSSLEVFHYKKDDWSLWANPMISPIIDDITMLEKMKLADMSALDGAISNIRLWRLGDLEHKILPNRGAIDKLRNILASNVGGGTMDLVWGPEIDFKESNTQVYKFLGSEKYEPVLNSIYAGLGIPPTLTGIAGQSGGFSNNFISLKTLIERLEYGRDLLKQFWQKEVEYIQKSMGFKTPPTLHFEHMLLSDEAAEKNLLVQLADRDIISIETLRNRFGELNDIEESRVIGESKKREKGKIPPKADPYHNGDIESDYLKIALQKDTITVDKVTDIDPKDVKEPTQQTGLPSKKKVPQNNGRPKLKRDTAPRKQKRVLPRTSPSEKAALLIWTQETQKKIADVINPAIIAHHDKKNLRELTKTQLSELEEVKFRTLCNMEPFSMISNEKIQKALTMGSIDSSFINSRERVFEEFVNKNSRNPSIDELRHINCVSYSFCEKFENLEK